MRLLNARFLPLLLAASLLVGALVIPTPAAAKPCYEDGQPAPPAAPNGERAREKCAAAVNGVVDATLYGYLGGRAGTYGVVAYSERVRAHFSDPNNRYSFTECSETGVYTTCSDIFTRRVAKDTDRAITNLAFVCVLTVNGFAPTPPAAPLPSSPLVPPPPATPAPTTACFATILAPALLPPEVGRNVPRGVEGAVGAAWGGAYTVIELLL